MYGLSIFEIRALSAVSLQSSEHLGASRAMLTAKIPYQGQPR